MIRPAKKSDFDQLLDLLQRLFGIEEDFEFDAEKQRKGLEMLLDSKSSIIMVAEKQHVVVGMVTAQLVISTAEGKPALLVEDLVVKPAWQNQKIGSELLQTVGDWGADHGANRLQLLADKLNLPALNFYQRKGLQQTQLICLRKFHH